VLRSELKTRMSFTVRLTIRVRVEVGVAVLQSGVTDLVV
jgi:hypothetical protein